MSSNDIPLDKAELLSALLECVLYGFSVLMFGATIWALSLRLATHQINRRMLIVACLLLFFSTVHLVIDVIRVMQGLVLYRDTWPKGPIGYFSDVSQWTFVYKNYVYTVQTLIGDGVILYRCYAVWQSKLIMVVPILLWCAVAATGFGSAYTASQLIQNEVFGGSLSRWIISFFASTLTTNVLTTFLLAYRIWYIDWKVAGIRSNRKSQLRPILYIVIDAGVIYSLTLLAALICISIKSNGQYVVLDMVPPIISIAFYMVIIRMGMASRANQQSTRHSLSGDRRTIDRNRMQVHVTTLTKSTFEDPHSSTDYNNRPSPSQIKFDEATAGEV